MPRQKSTHVDSPAAVGERLKVAREKAGLSQRQLSFPGCSPAYISRIESGDRIPSLQLLRELGRRLGVSEDYLATGSDVRGDRGGVLVEAEVALRLNELDEAERLYSSLLEGTPPALRAEGARRTGSGRVPPRRAANGDSPLRGGAVRFRPGRDGPSRPGRQPRALIRDGRRARIRDRRLRALPRIRSSTRTIPSRPSSSPCSSRTR